MSDEVGPLSPFVTYRVESCNVNYDVGPCRNAIIKVTNELSASRDRVVCFGPGVHPNAHLAVLDYFMAVTAFIIQDGCSRKKEQKKETDEALPHQRCKAFMESVASEKELKVAELQIEACKAEQKRRASELVRSSASHSVHCCWSKQDWVWKSRRSKPYATKESKTWSAGNYA